MPELAFSSSFDGLLVLVGFLVAFGLAFFTYRTTIPPIPRGIRNLLIVLRGSALFLLFFFLGEPILSIIQSAEEPPVTVILADDSKSMTIRDPGGLRSEQLRHILQSDPIRRLEEIGAARLMAFGSRIRELKTDSLQFRDDHTDITSALKAINRDALTNNIQSIVLLSDGNVTAGPSPIFEPQALSLPVFAVSIGDTSEQRDLLVRKIVTNTVVYAGTRIPVHAQIRSSGAGNQRVEVRLRHGSETLDRQTLSLEAGIREYSVKLSYIPREAGIQRYTVEVTEVPGELTTRNNQTQFFARVLESKIRVLLLAGEPGPDVAFVRRSLEADSSIAVSAFIERGGGLYYGPAADLQSLENQQCLILLGFPARSTPASSITLVARAAQQGMGILFIPSRTMDVQKLDPLIPMLPVNLSEASGSEQTVFFHVSDTRTKDILLQLPSTLASETWSDLPPLFSSHSTATSKPESRIHAVARIRTSVTDQPLLVSRNINRRKSVALLAYGLWRWPMLADASTTRILDTFLGNCVRWLTTREEDSRIRVRPLKDVFTVGEPVEFSAQIYDEIFQPVEGAQINVIIRAGRTTVDGTLRPLGHGQYEGQFNGFEEGDYTFEATVHDHAGPLGRATGRFSVGESNAEFLETRSNALLMRQLASRTDGRFYSSETLSTLPDDIRNLSAFRPREIRRSTELAFWTLPWSLLAAITLVSLEWLLRKRKGML